LKGLLVLMFWVSAVARAQVSEARPGAPGSGGAAYFEARQTHGAVEVMALGEGMQRAYVFLPAQPGVRGKVPFVFFAHGWQAMNPKNYGALIDHLAREGLVVVYPVYQETDATSPQLVAAAAAQAERKALAALKERGIEPDPQRVVDFGYSMGVAISLKLAANAKVEELPIPQALVAAAPGDAYHVARGVDARSIWPEMSALPKTLPIAIVTGEDDKAIGLPTGRKLAEKLCSAGQQDRHVLIVLSGDEHAGRKVNAGHGSPGAPDSRYDFELKTPVSEIPKLLAGRSGFEESASLNQLDFYGYWKVLDSVIDSLADAPSTNAKWVPPATVFGSVSARGFVAKKWDLGTWADGTPYKPGFTENPCRMR
jgi:dienelactone hydrolase